MEQLAGTVAITNGTASIAGTATSFVGSVFEGDAITIDRIHWYRVTADPVDDLGPLLIDPVFGETTVTTGTMWVWSYQSDVAFNTSIVAFINRTKEALPLSGASRTLTLNKTASTDTSSVLFKTANTPFGAVGIMADNLTALQQYINADAPTNMFKAVVAGTSPSQTLTIGSRTLHPHTDAGFALGLATFRWAGLHLSNTSAIVWNNAYTLTHSTGLLTTSGGFMVTGASGVAGATGTFNVNPRDASANAWSLFSATGTLTFYASGGTPGERINITQAGVVTITALATGSLTSASGVITSSSDALLKDVRKPFVRSINDLMKMDAPVLYNWNEKSGLDRSVIYAGWTAQGVRKGIPEAVYGPDGKLSLFDRAILAATVNAVIKHEHAIAELKHGKRRLAA